MSWTSISEMGQYREAKMPLSVGKAIIVFIITVITPELCSHLGVVCMCAKEKGNDYSPLSFPIFFCAFNLCCLLHFTGKLTCEMHFSLSIY